MKLVILSVLFGASLAARLDNTYLPPSGARGSGGYTGPGFGGAPRFTPQAQNIRPVAPQIPQQQAYSGGSYSGSVNANNNVPILRYDNDNDGSGNYNYAYETGNGIQAQERGSVRGGGPEDSVVAQGSFSYTAPDGQAISIQYTADENGFQPVGAHLPTPPPIPEEILKSIQQNLADEARGIVDDGQYKPSGDSGAYSHSNAGAYSGIGAGSGAGVGAGGYSGSVSSGFRQQQVSGGGSGNFVSGGGSGNFVSGQGYRY